jgi:Tat protein translocase TatB subunit
VFGIQPTELIIILVLALIVLGPDRLPSAMRSAGRTYRQVRTMLDDAQQELAQTIDFELDDDPPVATSRRVPRAEPAGADAEPRPVEAGGEGDASTTGAGGEYGQDGHDVRDGQDGHDVRDGQDSHDGGEGHRDRAVAPKPEPGGEAMA